MKEYEILEHKADLKIRAFGKTKEELFLNMLKGMSDSQKPELKEERVKRNIEIKSQDSTTILVDFLSEILYLGQIKKETFFDVKFKKFSEKEIRAEIFGQKVERFNEDIKAATYHELDIRKLADSTWEAIVLFDI